MFGPEDAPDLHFGVNSHAQLGCLCRGQLADSLFDQVFFDWLSIEGLVERDVCFAQATVCHLPFVTTLGDNPANRLALIW